MSTKVNIFAFYFLKLVAKLMHVQRFCVHAYLCLMQICKHLAGIGVEDNCHKVSQTKIQPVESLFHSGGQHLS